MDRTTVALFPDTQQSSGAAVGGSSASAAAATRASASVSSRIAILAFGILAYGAFLLTFLYLIGWVTGILTPTTVDTGISAQVGEALLINTLLLLAFGIQHSVMARRPFKAWLTRFVPQPIERSIFVLATCAVLALLFTSWRALPGTLWSVSGAFGIALQVGSFLGFGIVLTTSFLIDHFELFGIRQVVHYSQKKPAPRATFRESGLYRYVRHPLMLGFLIAFWSSPTMSMSHLLFSALATVYILIGVHFEERTLLAEHSDVYRDYQRRVPMLFPLRLR